jgi:hypothetical protein
MRHPLSLLALLAAGTLPAAAHMLPPTLVESGNWNAAAATADPFGAMAELLGLDIEAQSRMQALWVEVDSYRRGILAPALDAPKASSWVAAAAADAAGEVQVGISDRVITPPKGCPLAGYGERAKLVPFLYQPFRDPEYYSKLFEPNRGVVHDLRAKAVVIDNGERRVCFLGVDSIGITQLIFEDVLARVAPLGIERDALIIGGSHTHSGNGDAADLRLWWLATTDIFDARIYAPMVENLAGAIEDAVADLAPARIGVGAEEEQIGLNSNRRGDPVLDPEITVIRVDQPDGTPRALLFNYAVHGTFLGADNLKFSGDCLGYAERHLEERFGPDFTAVFLNGAEGDMSGSNQGGDSQWERADLWGAAMADAVAEVHGHIATESSVELAGAHIFVDLPDPYMRPAFFLDPPGPGYGTIDLDGLVEEDQTNFSGVRIGDHAFVTMPGEAIVQIGLDIKAHGVDLGFSGTSVIGLANGHLGYLTTAEEYWQGGYESGATFFGPETGEIMTGSADQVLDLLAPERGH